MKENEIPLGLAFDDALIIPMYSEVAPNDVDTKTKIAKELKINIPLASAAMETVTESKLAIALARQGGIGFLHACMSIEKQTRETDKVKRSEHGIITDPFSLTPNNYVREAEALMARYRISGVPITENKILVGIITNRDIRFETNLNKKIYEVMTKENLVTAPVGITLEEAREILRKSKHEKLPIVDERGRLRGLITVKDINKSAMFPNSCKDESGRLRVGAAVGIDGDYIERARALFETNADVILIDAPRGHSRSLIEALKTLRAELPSAQIIAGSVATPEGALALIEAGADGIKIGAGASSVSTTRIVTGVGVPQLSAILNCAAVIKKTAPHIPIIADGGIRHSGDITKAIAAGASACVLGNIFAGCDESPSEIESYMGRQYKTYKRSEQYLEFTGGTSVPEGVEGRAAYRGSLKNMISQLIGGLQIGMSYVGASTIRELQEKARFIRETSRGLAEGRPNHVDVTRDAPNYSE